MSARPSELNFEKRVFVQSSFQPQPLFEQFEVAYDTSIEAQPSCVVDKVEDQTGEKPATPCASRAPIGEGGIRTHGTVTRTTVFEFYDFGAELHRAVPKCVLSSGIFIAPILSCDAWYRAPAHVRVRRDKRSLQAVQSEAT